MAEEGLSPPESSPEKPSGVWTRDNTRIDLKPGLNSFNYTDPIGRIIPVYYYLPSQFATEPVEQVVEPLDIVEPGLDEGPVQVTAPDATDLAEEAAEDESEVEDNLEETPIRVSTKDDDESDDRVFKFQKDSFTSQDVVFVMHGVFRDAKNYCMHWKQHAKKYNILVVCPEFSVQYFPRIEDYNMGGVGDEHWGFSAIEHIFDILNNSGVRRNGYHMYGHSAGAQFAHRYAMFMSKHCRLVTCVCANAGWYTFPLMDSPHPFPYSLRRVPARYNERHLRLAFSRQVCILLGQDDETMAFLRR